MKKKTFNLNVSAETHKRFMLIKYNEGHKSADALLNLLLDEHQGNRQITK